MSAIISQIITLTLTQFFGVVGVFFLFGFLLYRLQQFTHTLYRQVLGWKGILLTAWIGTPFHELSHAALAVLFGFKIEKVSLFHPDEQTGQLGHVDYNYNRHNPLHHIGQFFVGAAPMIVGPIILALLATIFLPSGQHLLDSLSTGSDSLSFTGTPLAIFSVFRRLWNLVNFYDWKFWIFLYTSFCVVTHLAPSPEDQKRMWHGCIALFILLFLINCILHLVGLKLSQLIISVGHTLSGLVALFLYAVAISLIHLFFAGVIFGPFIWWSRR